MYPSQLYGGGEAVPLEGAAAAYPKKVYNRMRAATIAPTVHYPAELYKPWGTAVGVAATASGSPDPESPACAMELEVVRTITGLREMRRQRSVRNASIVWQRATRATRAKSSQYSVYSLYDDVDAEDEEDATCAAATIQRMFRMHRALKQAEDNRTWEAFKAMDEAQEWHVVSRMNKLKQLQDTLCNIAGVSVRQTLPGIRDPRAFPCPTIGSIKAMVSGFEEGKTLPLTDAMAIVEASILLFSTEPSVTEMPSNNCSTVVVGDLHGSWYDLMHILQRYGYPGTSLVQYVFNGDLVDRGDKSCEVLLTVLSLKLLAPRAVRINRGNHEDVDMNMYYGFADEAREKYGTAFYQLCSELFFYLPYASTLNEKVCILHGGIPADPDFTLQELASFARGPDSYAKYTARERHIVDDILWSDPTKNDAVVGSRPSTRGKGTVFGKNVTVNFLKNNDMGLLVRSHEEQKSGYRVSHEGKLITIFSASDYGGHANGAGVLFFDPGSGLPRAHEWVRPHDQRMKRLGRKGQSRYDTLIHYTEEVLAENNEELRAYWKAIDTSNSGWVSVAEWQEGIERVVNIAMASLPPPLRFQFFHPDAGCKKNRGVQYLKFLDYYQQKYLCALEAYGSTLSWHHDAIDDLVRHLKSKKLDFERAFNEFDTDRDGVLSMKEFKAAIRQVVSLDILSDQQIITLALHFDVDHDGSITRDEFLKRLSEHNGDDPSASPRKAPAIPHLVWVEDRRQETFKRLRERLSAKVSSQEQLAEKLAKYDKDGDGRINAMEMTEAMDKEYGLTACFNDLYELGLCSDPKAGGKDPTDNLMKFATKRNFPVASARVVGRSVKERRGLASLFQPLVQYHIEVRPLDGRAWIVKHRFTDFVKLRATLGAAMRSTPFPSGALPIYSDSSLDARQAKLDAWLGAVVDHVSRADSGPSVLRTFLLVPAGEVVARPAGSEYPPIRIERLAATLYRDASSPKRRLQRKVSSMQRTFAPALGSVLLKLLYKYKVELKALLNWEETAVGMACSVEDFRSALQSLNELEGFPLTKTQLNKFVDHVDKNKDGWIDYNELETAVSKTDAAYGNEGRRPSMIFSRSPPAQSASLPIVRVATGTSHSVSGSSADVAIHGSPYVVTPLAGPTVDPTTVPEP